MSIGETLGSMGFMLGKHFDTKKILGPLFGSMLYGLGGYIMPFIFFGSLSTFMAIIVGFLMGNQQIGSNNDQVDPLITDEKKAMEVKIEEVHEN